MFTYASTSVKATLIVFKVIKVVDNYLVKMGSSRWLNTADETSKDREGDRIRVPHPSKLTGWVNDMKLWPGVSDIDIIN